MNKLSLLVILLVASCGISSLHAARLTAVKVVSKINVTIDGKYFTS